MTLHPARCSRPPPSSSPTTTASVATIYARASGLEIVCRRHYSAEYSHDREALIEHLGVTITRAGPRA
jgi:hypothetical protein